MSPLELPIATFFEWAGIKLVGQRLRIGQRLPAIKLYSSLFIAAALVFCILTTTVNAQEKLFVQDYSLTKKCKDIIDKHGFDTFEIKDNEFTLPTILVRDPESELQINAVRFSAFFYGLLFERSPDSLLYCYDKHAPNFIVVERTERFMIFENGSRQATEAHIHSYISCGSNCGYARFESITFFDDPKVSPEEEGMVHSAPLPPLYWLGGDTHPNEYPSRWFRSYLTDDERATFDRIICEG